MAAHSLAAYRAVFRASWREQFAYRGNFFIEMLGSLVTTLVVMALWQALFHASDQPTIGGYSLPAMMTYLLGVGLVEAALHLQNQGARQLNDIADGTLNAALVKPLSPFLIWLAHDLARKTILFLLAAGSAAVAMVVFWPWLDFQPTTTAIVSFLGFLPIAALLHYALFCVFSLAAFWIGRSWGLTFLLRVTMLLATGAVLPLEFLPDGIREVFLLLPFQYFGYVPIQVLLGNIHGLAILSSVVQAIAWLVGVFVAAGLVYRLGLRRYGAYGG
jgi:ABC-2 type transport system permease protein